MKYYKKLGVHGEDFASQIVYDRGYEIVTRNYRCKSGEIDIIAKQGNCYHFIEVKTRSNFDYGNPSEAVTQEKQRRIKRAAEYYMMSHGYKNRDCMIQFDVIEVSINMMWGCF